MQRGFALLIAGSYLAASTAIAAPRETRESMIVMDLVAERGFDEGLQRLLNELILTEFTRAGLLQVTGGSDLQALISNEEKKALLGCDDATCLAEIGGALGANYLTVASVGRIGDFYLLNMKVIAAGSAEVAARTSKQVEGKENALVTAVREAVAEIIRTMTPEAKAPLATKPAGPLQPAEVKATPAEARTTVATSPPEGTPTSAGEGGSVLPWIAAGVGVLAAGSGTAFGLMARNELKYSPVDPRFTEARKKADSRAMVATVSWGVAGAALVAAGVLFALDLMGDDAPEASPSVSSDGAAVLIRF